MEVVEGEMVTLHVTDKVAGDCGYDILSFDVIVTGGQDPIMINLPPESGHIPDVVSPTPTPIPTPVAGFTAVPTSGTSPLTVYFNSGTSIGPLNSYQWDYGDGT